MENIRYKDLTENIINDNFFHKNLIGHIEDARELCLEKSYPNFKVGQIIYPKLYKEHLELKENISVLTEADNALEENLPKIKYNFIKHVLKN